MLKINRDPSTKILKLNFKHNIYGFHWTRDLIKFWLLFFSYSTHFFILLMRLLSQNFDLFLLLLAIFSLIAFFYFYRMQSKWKIQHFTCSRFIFSPSTKLIINFIDFDLLLPRYKKYLYFLFFLRAY